MNGLEKGIVNDALYDYAAFSLHDFDFLINILILATVNTFQNETKNFYRKVRQ